jgi:hypothetical protein
MLRLGQMIVLLGFVAVIPARAADVTGTWTYEDHGGVQVWGKTQGGHATPDIVTITLKEEGTTLTGTVSVPRTGAARVPNVKQISNGKIDGDNLSFETSEVVLGTQMITHWAGTVDGDVIHFTSKSGGGAGKGRPIDAHRAAAATGN